MAAINRFDEFCPERESWDAFLERFQCFLQANDYASLPTDRKRGFFLSSCGREMFATARALAAPIPVYDIEWDVLLAKLKGHYAPAPSRFARRYALRQCIQRENESVNQYIASLRASAIHCEFADLDDALLEQFICGVRDKRLQRRLLSRSELTLKIAVDEARAAEMADRSTSVIQKYQLNDALTPNLSSVHQQHEEEQLELEEDEEVSRLRNSGSRGSFPKTLWKACLTCGGNHLRSTCKFKTAVCRRCGKKGHLANVCRALLPVNQPEEDRFNNRRPEKNNKPRNKCFSVSDQDSGIQEWAVSSASVKQQGEKKIHLNVLIEGRPCKMELDTGSAKSIISWATLQKLIPSITRSQLSACPCRLKDYQGNAIPVLGGGCFNVQFGQFQGQLPLIVVTKSLASLLGLDWFKALGLSVSGINSISPENEFLALTQEFSDVFENSLGKYKGNPISLNIDPQIAPIRLKARRVPLAIREKVDSELDKLVAQGILEPVDHAPWETPIVVPIKSDGSIRICGDFKSTLNKALQAHPYPVPVVQHILHSLGQGKVFAKLDLAQAYQQLPVDETTAVAQTIVTHRGAFKCRRLQFGVSVAPGLFQSLMERLLHGLPGVVPYFDDVLIAAGSASGLVKILRQVFLRFREAGLKLKPTKCKLGVPAVEFLGYLIDGQGIHPTPSKVEAITAAPVPTSKAELQAFLGLLNFYSVFLPHKASVAEPLHRLLDNSAPWVWTSREANAFMAVKRLLISSAVLVQYSDRLPLVLACDASPFGVGAVLSHAYPNGLEAPIAYYSRTLSKAERKYSQIDKEALAAVAGVKKFHHYIYGRSFQLVTDHKPLLGILAGDRPTPQILSPRMSRWAEFLAAYSYSLVHRPGKEMGHADALSRCPLPTLVADPAPSSQVLLVDDLALPLSAADIAQCSKMDKVLLRVLDWVRRGWPPGNIAPEFLPFYRRRLELSELQGCLLWGVRVVVPSDLRHQILLRLHEGHPGIVRMKSLGRSYVWWPNMDGDIEDWVRRCHPCQQTRPAPPAAPVREWESPQAPWSRIHVDFAGPFLGQTLLVVVDALSKWVELFPMHSTTAEATIRVLTGLFATHGLPDTLVSDNGPQFISSSFQTYLAGLGIRHVLVAPYHPAGNGLAERAVRSAKDALSRLTQGSWATKIAAYLFAQHTTPCQVTGKSPAEILMGRRLRTTLDRLHPSYSTHQPLTEPYSPRSFSVGEGVYVQNFMGNPKWLPGWVTHITGPCSYRIQLVDGRLWRRHVNHLRRRVPEELRSFPAIPTSSDLPDADCRQDTPSPVQPVPVPPDAILMDDLPGGTRRSPGVGVPAVVEPPTSSPTPSTEDTPFSRPTSPELRRSGRVRRRPAYLQDYACAIQGEGVLCPQTL